jgi:hypothetical protein
VHIDLKKFLAGCPVFTCFYNKTFQDRELTDNLENHANLCSTLKINPNENTCTNHTALKTTSVLINHHFEFLGLRVYRYTSYEF